MVGGLRHLAHEVRGEEDGAAFPGQMPGEGAHPHDALGVEAVHRLVEDERLRVAEERGGDAEPLAHAEREAADPAARDALQPGERDDLVDPPRADPVRRRHRAQVLARGASAVHGLGIQQHAHSPQRVAQLPIGHAVDACFAGGGPVEAHDHAHGRRLAGAVRPEESRHEPGAHREVDVVDRGGGAEGLRELVDFDHPPTLTIGGWMPAPTPGRRASARAAHAARWPGSRR
ncbi:hypothetical protein GCM10025881_32600 [Pseudolysinimonas kribbensis]|uniref:Uncharacterized protein n=1 Tax=Pseudolysinimonas kribbensis TaxID=433641 RepID=A0ABQ6K9P8_9MICO|nr:hypothetical protein GCM10025881_32600 [Pseudolysinimonas kribbensis]